MTLGAVHDHIAAARASLPDVTAADTHIEAAWNGLRGLEHRGARLEEVVATWLELAQLIIVDWTPLAMEHGHAIADDRTRREWYRRLRDTLSSVFDGYRAINRAGYVQRDLDDTVGLECAQLLDGLDLFVAGAARA